MTDVATPTAERPTADEPDWEPGRGPIDWLGGWRVLLVGSAALLALALAIRIFQQFTAWTIGIDASSEDFGLYYRSLFIAEVLGVTAGTLLWWGYLVRKGRTVVTKEVRHSEEVRRIAVFWGLIGITCDIQGIEYVRSQTPEYLRIIEHGSLRTFLGETQYVSLVFGATVAVAGYWVGQFIARALAIWPIGRFMKKW